MDFTHTLDSVITEALALGFDERQIADLLLAEADAVSEMPLTEARRKYRSMPGGGKALISVQGRVDPRRRIAARKAARKGKAARMRAARNPQSKMKRRRTMMARRRSGIRTRGINLNRRLRTFRRRR